MNILIVAATTFEIRPFAAKLPLISHESDFLSTYLYNNSTIDILIPGVGMMFTAWHLGKRLAAKKYQMAFNVGIAGAFDPSVKIGSVMNVTEDCILELGAEDGTQFLDIFELGLMDPDQYPYEGGRLINSTRIKSKVLDALPSVGGSTVNTIHEKRTGGQTDRRSAGHADGRRIDIESMEGAAFLYACLSEKIPCAQIRSISNYIEERDKSRWNVKLALDNLNKTLLEIVKEVST
jgi:futalosine hydrolase